MEAADRYACAFATSSVRAKTLTPLPSRPVRASKNKRGEAKPSFAAGSVQQTIPGTPAAAGREVGVTANTSPSKTAKLGASPKNSSVTRMVTVAWLCRCRSAAASVKNLAPSPNATGTEATGYQATLPNPLNPTNSSDTRSQSDPSAISDGVP